MKANFEPTKDKDIESVGYLLARESLLGNDDVEPNRGSILRFKAAGESMLPAIWPGDTVEIARCAMRDLRIGDIVFSARDGRFFLHRLTSICDDSGFVLLGDSMPGPDAKYPKDALLGRMVGGVDEGFSLNVFVHRGVAAKISRILGLVLCHWNFARRIALGVHRRRQDFLLNRHSLAKSKLSEIKLGEIKLGEIKLGNQRTMN